MGSNVVVSDNGVRDHQPGPYDPAAHQYPKAFYKADPKATAGYRVCTVATPDEEAKVAADGGWTTDFSTVDPNRPDNPLAGADPVVVPVQEPPVVVPVPAPTHPVV